MAKSTLHPFDPEYQRSRSNTWTITFGPALASTRRWAEARAEASGEEQPGGGAPGGGSPTSTAPVGDEAGEPEERPVARRTRSLGDSSSEEIMSVLDTPQIYQGFNDEDLGRLVAFALILNGKVDGGIPDFLVALCRTWAVRIPVAERLQLEAALCEGIQKGETGAHALLPLIVADTDTSVVSTATLDLCCVTPTEEGELAGPRHAMALFESGIAANRAGVFLGLLSLGDRRVLAMLTDLRLALAREEVKHILSGKVQFLHGPVVEFLVDWLSTVEPEGDESPFGTIAGFLYRMAREHAENGVIELQRVFPASLEEASVITMGSWSIADFGERLRPQLEALAGREQDPKVIPLVMKAWGMEG